MNEIPRRDRHADQIARMRAIVQRHALPDFIDGFDIALGEFADEPALWVTFRLRGGADVGLAELERRASILVPLQQAVHEDLAKLEPDRFPFFRVSYSQSLLKAQ